MLKYETLIQKFNKKGEKSGWTYIVITHQQAEKLHPGSRTTFRVKGTLDEMPIEKTALLPMGDGSYILPINGTMRKTLAKKEGDKLTVSLQEDKRELKLSSDFIACLKDEPVAYEFFCSLPKSHQQYFSKWIESAKTDDTKAKRIAMSVMGLAMRQGYSEMMRANKGR
jgi:hypothetical protein